MKKQNNLQTNKIYALIALLVIWEMICVMLFINYTPHISVLGISLSIFIVIFSLTQLFPYSSWTSFVLGTLIFIGLGYSLLNNTQEFLISSGIGAGTFLITTTLCILLVKRIHYMVERYSRLKVVIDSLLIYDPNTNLMRWKFAKQALSTEILRGRRYENDVSLILFDIRNKDEFLPDDIRRIQRSVAEIIQNSIRTDIDIGFIGSEIGLILPETNSSGAEILTKRLINRFSRKVDAHLAAGIASFPKDAVTEKEIIESTEDALTTALHSSHPVINYHDLRSNRGTEEVNTELETQEESNPPIDLRNEFSSQQEYTTILENINLNENEWLVWIEGFNQMSDLILVEKSLNASDFVDDLEFLFLQANHLVVKVRSISRSLTEETRPFPGWRVKKANSENHYLLISKDESIPDTDVA